MKKQIFCMALAIGWCAAYFYELSTGRSERFMVGTAGAMAGIGNAMLGGGVMAGIGNALLGPAMTEIGNVLLGGRSAIMNESKPSSKELWQQARNAPGTSDYRRAHLELQRRWESSQRPAAALAEPIMPSDKAVALKQWAGASAPVKDAPPAASLRKATVNLSDYVAAPAPSRGPFGEGEATLCLQPPTGALIRHQASSGKSRRIISRLNPLCSARMAGVMATAFNWSGLVLNPLRMSSKNCAK